MISKHAEQHFNEEQIPMRPEVITILKALNNKNSTVLAMEKKIMKTLVEEQYLQSFVDELKNEVELTTDASDGRVPFYNFYLAVILLKEDKFDEAKDLLAESAHEFHILGWRLNEALSEWLFSAIHFENEDYERAKRACDSAIGILRSMIRQNENESHYEAARELSAYLAQLGIFEDNIDTMIASDKALKKYHTKLKNDIEYLRRQKKKIHPTFVANDYYLSKILLMPAHYVYASPADPITEQEKQIYQILLDKVGFYQIIEKLIEMEKEFAPNATREDLLHRINLAWDKDVSA